MLVCVCVCVGTVLSVCAAFCHTCYRGNLLTGAPNPSCAAALLSMLQLLLAPPLPLHLLVLPRCLWTPPLLLTGNQSSAGIIHTFIHSSVFNVEMITEEKRTGESPPSRSRRCLASFC